MNKLCFRIFFIYLIIICSDINAGKIYTPGSHENFKEILRTYDLVVVDFYADWCEPCRRMHKVFENLAQDRELDDVLFVKVNTELHRTIATEYHILTLPTIIFFVDGTIINTIYGAHDKKTIKQIIINSFFS